MVLASYLLLLMISAGAWSLKEDSTAELFRDVLLRMEERRSKDGLLFDIEDDDTREELHQLFDEYGIDSRILMEDGFISGIWNMFTSGDKMKAFTTYNFAYQIGCYQGKKSAGKRIWATSKYTLNKYNEYGCHCGGGNSYGKPLDETDRCCKIHDQCYEKVEKTFNLKSGCETYSTQYTTTCCRNQKITKCNDGGPSAARALCECDQDMARCIASRKALREYNIKNKNARKRTKCRVAGKRTERRSILSAAASCVGMRRRRTAQKITFSGQGACQRPKKKPTKKRWW